MNQIAIAIQCNQNHIGIAFQFPKLATLKAVARRELGWLKCKARNAIERVAVNRVVERVAMAFNPMPAMALA